jgi:hypothetical protein
VLLAPSPGKDWGPGLSRPTFDTLEIWEGQDALLRNRVTDSTGTVVLDTDDVTAVNVRIWNTEDRRDGKKLLEDADSDAYLFDELQTGDGWTKDATGFNFEYTHTWDSFKKTGGKKYRIEVVLSTNDYGNVPIVWDLIVHGMRSF